MPKQPLEIPDRAAVTAPTQFAGSTAEYRRYDGPSVVVPPKSVSCSLEIIKNAIFEESKNPNLVLDLKSVVEWLKNRNIIVMLRGEILDINIESLRRVVPGVYRRVSVHTKIYTIAIHTSVKSGKLVPPPKFFGYAWAVVSNAEHLANGEITRAVSNMAADIAIEAVSKAIAMSTIGAAISSMPVILGTMPALAGGIAIVGVGILVSAGLRWALNESQVIESIESIVKEAEREVRRGGQKTENEMRRGGQQLRNIINNPHYTPALFGAPARPVW